MDIKSEVLRKFFGYESFRYGQYKIIDSILSGRDTLGIMPTGAGKSICFQIPAIIFDGMTIVISPLISLMKDQVNSLMQSGISCAYLNSSLTYEEYTGVLRNAFSGVYKILYVAPERLLNSSFLNLVNTVKISMVTIDEAHCVSQWGHDFRPTYLKIAEFISCLKYRPVVSAFTATATSYVKEDIIKALQLNSPYVLTTGFDRENLYFGVEKPKDKLKALLEIAGRNKNKSGIIYCATRKNVETVCEQLIENGFNATRYHAGLSDEERRFNQDSFIFDRKNIIVATNAFGMGIDKSNVSYVVHYNLPKNIESYYQEAGRAGRDGEPAECIILYSGSDVMINKYLIEHSNDGNLDTDPQTAEKIKKHDLELLRTMANCCTTDECIRGYILKYFGEKAPDFCGNCSSCGCEFEIEDITVEAQKIMSCIYRVKQKSGRLYGINIILDILRGSKSERIIKNGFDTLSTYGISKDIPNSKLLKIADYLIAKGYIISELFDEKYKVVTLSRKSPDVLTGKEKVFMRASVPKAADGNNTLSYDEELFQKLKDLRADIAHIQSLPAYIVFSDSSLKDMCIKMPETPEEFLKVSGVGVMRLEKYGQKFIKLISNYKKEKTAAD